MPRTLLGGVRGFLVLRTFTPGYLPSPLRGGGGLGKDGAMLGRTASLGE